MDIFHLQEERAAVEREGKGRVQSAETGAQERDPLTSVTEKGAGGNGPTQDPLAYSIEMLIYPFPSILRKAVEWKPRYYYQFSFWLEKNCFSG